ncbi:unnamed protein product [Notodromas monacha]|uniref:Cyanocobalamin reductase (cyanide-eliminating) n=1 Tax=Notodromas monacha TaxID=399045 RepID=A0A7R9GB26_9CRUS|nr:unnamed protein product [Notodromas monacha]CAG0916080.1 unnamed protein product [Notodromas monacha]
MESASIKEETTESSFTKAESPWGCSSDALMFGCTSVVFKQSDFEDDFPSSMEPIPPQALPSLGTNSAQQKADEIFQVIEAEGHKYGIEAHRFLVGWYNDQVGPQFRIPYDPDTLAFLFISTPSMFEKAFIPFVNSNSKFTSDETPNEAAKESDSEDEIIPEVKPKILDPIDRCSSSVLRSIAEELAEEVDIISDFEMINRRPRILVQTMGHVAGAAYLYHKKDLTNDSAISHNGENFLGVSIHPLFGGWFAFRGAMVVKNFLCPDLPRKPCVDVVPDESRRIWLLNEFNTNWNEWTYRDVIPVCARYSDLQKKYFGTVPAQRQELIDSYLKQQAAAGDLSETDD